MSCKPTKAVEEQKKGDCMQCIHLSIEDLYERDMIDTDEIIKIKTDLLALRKEVTVLADQNQEITSSLKYIVKNIHENHVVHSMRINDLEDNQRKITTHPEFNPKPWLWLLFSLICFQACVIVRLI